MTNLIPLVVVVRMVVNRIMVCAVALVPPFFVIYCVCVFDFGTNIAETSVYCTNNQ